MQVNQYTLLHSTDRIRVGHSLQSNNGNNVQSNFERFYFRIFLKPVFVPTMVMRLKIP